MVSKKNKKQKVDKAHEKNMFFVFGTEKEGEIVFHHRRERISRPVATRERKVALPVGVRGPALMEMLKTTRILRTSVNDEAIANATSTMIPSGWQRRDVDRLVGKRMMHRACEASSRARAATAAAQCGK